MCCLPPSARLRRRRSANWGCGQTYKRRNLRFPGWFPPFVKARSGQEIHRLYRDNVFDNVSVIAYVTYFAVLMPLLSIALLFGHSIPVRRSEFCHATCSNPSLRQSQPRRTQLVPHLLPCCPRRRPL